MISQIFNNLLVIVSEVTETDINNILSTNKSQDLVTIRILIFYVLRKHLDFSVGNIAKCMKCTKANVHYHLNNFDFMLEHNKILKLYYQITIKRLDNITTETIQ